MMTARLETVGESVICVPWVPFSGSQVPLLVRGDPQEGDVGEAFKVKERRKLFCKNKTIMISKSTK